LAFRSCALRRSGSPGSATCNQNRGRGGEAFTQFGVLINVDAEGSAVKTRQGSIKDRHHIIGDARLDFPLCMNRKKKK